MKDFRPNAVLLAMSFAAVAGCGNEAPSAAPPTERILKVEVAIAALETVNVKLNAVGNVRASAEAVIRPQVDGVVAEIAYSQGGSVSAGDLLIRLDDAKADARVSLAQASVDSARARLKLAEQRLARGRSLIAEKLVSQEAFDRLEAEFTAAEAEVREEKAALTLAERQLADYYIRAPFDGVVGARLVDLGNFVQNGDELVVLMKTHPVEVEFKVPDRYMHRIQMGTDARISSSTGGPSVKAHVSFIDPRVDPTTRMLNLRLEVDNEDDTFKPGQFVKVEALVEQRTSQVVVPEEAIILAGGRTWVFVIEDDRAAKRAVEVGQRTPGKVEILEGIATGDRLVIGGQHRLAEGSRVEIVTDDSAPGA
jgi:membrane fusion protein (multidrug efflux system)